MPSPSITTYLPVRRRSRTHSTFSSGSNCERTSSTPSSLRDGLADLLPVAREQDGAASHFLPAPAWPRRLLCAEHRQSAASPETFRRRRPSLRKIPALGASAGGTETPSASISARVPTMVRAPSTAAHDAFAGEILELFRLANGQRPFLGLLGDRLGQRMLGKAFGRRGDTHDLLRADARRPVARPQPPECPASVCRFYRGPRYRRYSALPDTGRP